MLYTGDFVLRYYVRFLQIMSQFSLLNKFCIAFNFEKSRYSNRAVNFCKSKIFLHEYVCENKANHIHISSYYTWEETFKAQMYGFLKSCR